jgi:very-short-patch-repair endonuclease
MENKAKQNGNIVTGQSIDPEKILRAKELRREMTEEERILWAYLRGDQLDGIHFRRQQIIDGWIVDFYCHSKCLVIEIDGPIHAAQKESDLVRDRILSERGLTVLRFSNQAIHTHLQDVLEQIRQFCRRSQQ